MTSLTIPKEYLTWEIFLVELWRARAKGAQLVTNLVTFEWVPFHSIKTSGLNFRQLPCTTEWNSIFAIYTKLSENYHRQVFFPHSTLLPNVLNFWLNGSHFGKVSESLGTFPGKYCTKGRCFQSFLRFGWMESAQNASKKFRFWENRPHVLRCPIDLSITYN